jgi:hypothetical protein
LRKQVTCSLPSFPPKKSFGNLDPEFVKHRREALSAYLSSLTTLEPVINTVAFRTFFV